MNKLLEIYRINANFLFGESEEMYEGFNHSDAASKLAGKSLDPIKWSHRAGIN